MADDYDQDYDFAIIQKSLTTAHLEMPDFGTDTEPAPQEAPAAPAAPNADE